MKTTPTWISIVILCVIGAAWVGMRVWNPGRQKFQPAGMYQVPPRMLGDSLDGFVPAPDRRMDREEIIRSWPGWLEAGTMDSFGEPPRTVVDATTAKPILVTNLLITAIWLQGNHRIAVINGCLVREGVEMSPLTVRSIGSDTVIFSTSTGLMSVPISMGGKPLDPVNPPVPPAKPPEVARSTRATGG